MLITGAGGFARELLELCLLLRPKEKIVFFDDRDAALLKIHDQYSVIKSFAAAEKHFTKKSDFCLGIGGVANRKKLYAKMIACGGKPVTLVSPFAHIGKHAVQIGAGSSVGTGTVITTNVTIGEGCLVNINATIGHDCRIGDFCEIAPGVHISGNCHIGNMCSIGTGAVILPGIRIGNNCSIGAGAVVTKNVAAGLTVTGMPAKPRK